MKVAVWFWVVTSLVTLFYGFGTTIFSLESLCSEAFLLRNFGEANTTIILGRPWWARLGYALSIYTGLVCCGFLLFRSPQAFWLAAVSVMGMLIQQYYWWTGMKIADTLKGADWIWPILIPLISLSLLALAQYVKKAS